MRKTSFFIAACIGACMGFAALDWIPGSALALAIGLLVVGVGVIPAAPTGRRKEVVVDFLGQPLSIFHAIIWSLSLVLSAAFVQYWNY